LAGNSKSQREAILPVFSMASGVSRKIAAISAADLK
jgi:hypothetical protein